MNVLDDAGPITTIEEVQSRIAQPHATGRDLADAVVRMLRSAVSRAGMHRFLHRGIADQLDGLKTLASARRAVQCFCHAVIGGKARDTRHHRKARVRPARGPRFRPVERTPTMRAKRLRAHGSCGRTRCQRYRAMEIGLMCGDWLAHRGCRHSSSPKRRRCDVA